MNPDTGEIRKAEAGTVADARELMLSDVEAKVLAAYPPVARPALLRGWRGGAFRVVVTPDGPRLVDVVDKAKDAERARIGRALATWKAKKARRRAAAESRAKPKKHARSRAHRGHGK